MSATDFPWLASGPRRRAHHPSRVTLDALARTEMVERAALYVRLGYPAARALARLKANAAWERGERGAPGVGDRELEEIVSAAYQRKSTR